MFMKLNQTDGTPIWIAPSTIGSMSQRKGKDGKTHTLIAGGMGDYDVLQTPEEINQLFAQIEVAVARLWNDPITSGYSEEDLIRASQVFKSPSSAAPSISLLPVKE